jgi:hypothetical protein
VCVTAPKGSLLTSERQPPVEPGADQDHAAQGAGGELAAVDDHGTQIDCSAIDVQVVSADAIVVPLEGEAAHDELIRTRLVVHVHEAGKDVGQAQPQVQAGRRGSASAAVSNSAVTANLAVPLRISDPMGAADLLSRSIKWHQRGWLRHQGLGGTNDSASTSAKQGSGRIESPCSADSVHSSRYRQRKVHRQLRLDYGAPRVMYAVWLYTRLRLSFRDVEYPPVWVDGIHDTSAHANNRLFGRRASEEWSPVTCA